MKYVQKLTDDVEAFQYDGDLKDTNGNYYIPDWAVEALEARILIFDSLDGREPCELFVIYSGYHRDHVRIGDYVVKHNDGMINVFSEDDFASFIKTYEMVGE